MLTRSTLKGFGVVVSSLGLASATNALAVKRTLNLPRIFNSNVVAAPQGPQTPNTPPSPQDDLSEEKRLSAEYLALMAQEPGAQVIQDGIVLRPIFVSGSATTPTSSDTVNVSYHLVDREGKVLDESITSDALAAFPLTRLIRCWQTALPLITTGSSYKLSCPSDTAYGDRGIPNLIKGGAALTFRVTLFSLN